MTTPTPAPGSDYHWSTKKQLFVDTESNLEAYYDPVTRKWKTFSRTFGNLDAKQQHFKANAPDWEDLIPAPKGKKTEEPETSRNNDNDDDDDDDEDEEDEHTSRSEIRIGQPSEFDGTKTKARSFWLSCRTYLALNAHIYDNAMKKIAFVLSFCRSGTAAAFADNLTSVALAYDPPNYGTWPDFQAEFERTFISSDVAGEARSDLFTLKQDGDADGYVAQFKILAMRAGITETNALVEYFQRGLKPALLNRIYGMNQLPSTMEEWYSAAIRLDNQYRRLRSMLGRTNNSTRSDKQDSSGKSSVNIKRLTDEQAAEYRKDGRCFRCGNKGHISRNCDKKSGNKATQNETSKPNVRNIRGNTTSDTKETPDAKETTETPTIEDRVTKIRALFAGLSNDDKDSIIDKLELSDF